MENASASVENGTKGRNRCITLFYSRHRRWISNFVVASATGLMTQPLCFCLHVQKSGLFPVSPRPLSSRDSTFFFVPRVTLPKNLYPEADFSVESNLTINVVDERGSLTSVLSSFSRIRRYIILVFNEPAFYEFYLLLYLYPNFLDFSLDYTHNLIFLVACVILIFHLYVW